MFRVLLRPRVERLAGVFLSFTGAVFILKEFVPFEDFRVLRREPLRVGICWINSLDLVWFINLTLSTSN